MARAAAGQAARPRGRAQVEEAILASARALIAERGPSGVALRDIAEGAGVNFGLVYHYFGTKDALLAAVYARATEHAAARLREVEHLDEALDVLMQLGDGTTARLVGWAALEGNDPAVLFGVSPALAVLAGIVRRDAARSGRRVTADEARVFAAFAMVVALGWRLFGPVALGVAGARSSDPTRYAAQVRGLVRQLAGGGRDGPVAPADRQAASPRRGRESPHGARAHRGPARPA
jgi:AcrR family transcriptional regulator